MQKLYLTEGKLSCNCKRTDFSTDLLYHRYVLAELRSSECEYVERLRVLTEVSGDVLYFCKRVRYLLCLYVIQDYLVYIQLDPTVPAELKADVLAIFCNLTEIYVFHNE